MANMNGLDSTNTSRGVRVTDNGEMKVALNAETTKVIGTINSKVADGVDITQGAKADAAATVGDSTPFSIVALLKGIFNKLGAVILAGQGKQASDTITMAAGADAHDALDVVSTAAGEILEFASLGSAGDMVCILGARMKYNVNAVPSGGTGYRLHLYNEAPTAIADDAAFNVPSADLAKYIGWIDIPTLTDVGDSCVTNYDNINFTAKLAGTGLYGILQCIGAETPAANAVFTILLNTVAV